MKFMHFRDFGTLSSLAVIAALVVLSSIRLVGDVGAALAASDPIIAAAGDIACDPSSSSFNGGNGSSGSCRQKYTSDLLVNGGFAAVLPLGDNQYYCGGYQAFLQSYDLSWGRVKSITRPAVGNHEYLTSGGTDCTSANAGAAGYFRYFGSAAGSPSQGYYSYDVGAWHLIALNTNCSSAGGCGSSSPQGLWLKADLEAHPNLCTLAYFHIPLFSSGGRANSNARTLWQILYDHNAEVILSGHDHIYERFAPQTANGALDTARGIRSFIVGTGGSNHTSLASIAANSELRNTDTFGILKLTLHPASYDWQFVPEAGKTFSDSGSAPCFGGTAPSITNTPSPTSVPSSTATRTATATSTGTGTNTPTATRTATATSSPTQTGAAAPTSTNSFTPPPTAIDPMNTSTATSTSTNTSTPSATGTTTQTATATAISGTATFSFTPAADSYVNEASPGTNYGASTQIRVDGSPLVRSYLRFNVQDVSGRITRATLRIYANSAAKSGCVANTLSDNTWTETGINYNNAPSLGSALGSSGSFGAGVWISMDVTSYITGSGTYSIVVTTPGSTAVSLASRESGANAPQLIVETGP